MKNTLIVIGVGLLILGSHFMGWEAGIKYQKKQSDSTKIYNSGYRSGRLDVTAELIECHGITDRNVTSIYYTMQEIMARLGELDTTPYPCTE